MSNINKIIPEKCLRCGSEKLAVGVFRMACQMGKCNQLPLLDKFDKDFDEKFAPHGFIEQDEEEVVPLIKSLAHSHLEEAYRAGHEDSKKQWEKNLEYVVKGERQSNLERLIEKCGDYFQNLRHLKSWSKTVEKGGWRARGYTFAPPHHHKTVNGSTPTEAVENLIKALDKDKS